MSFNKFVTWLDNNEVAVLATLNILSLGFGSLMEWAEKKICEDISTEELRILIEKEEKEHKEAGLPYKINGEDWARIYGFKDED